MTPEALKEILRQGDELIASEYHAPRMERFMAISLLLPQLLAGLRELNEELIESERVSLELRGQIARPERPAFGGSYDPHISRSHIQAAASGKPNG